MELEKGFTLSEVLITLVVIGVIAAITIPSVLQSQERKDTVVKVKKAYNTLSNAYLQARLEYGTPDTWDFGDRDEVSEDKDFVASNAKTVMDKLFAKANIVKACYYTKDFKDCNLADEYFNENADKSTPDSQLNAVSTGAVLNDGISYIFLANDGNCKSKRGSGLHLENICANVYADINGRKGPNKFGHDLFMFYLTKYGVIPTGSRTETVYEMSNPIGQGRTAWVLYNENLDYLDCPDKLGWDKKKSCKE